MNLSNKRWNGNVLGAMLGLMVGGLTLGATPAQAQLIPTPPPPPLAEVTDVTKLDKAIKALQGKVVLVNFWATWHETSAAQYPAFLYLYDHYHLKGLEVISVATDPVDTREQRVIPFIQSYKTKFATYMKPDGDPEAFLKGIDTTWTGTLPRTYLIGRDGKIRQVYNARINPTPFEATIVRLLKEEAPKPKNTEKSAHSFAPAAPPRNPRGILGGN